MIGVCPGCGKPFRVEQAKSGEGLVYCEDVCISPAAMPTGVRMMPDQATKLYVDGNMNEMNRELYIKTHGFDPEPVMQAVITVPAYFNDSERQAIKDAGKKVI